MVAKTEYRKCGRLHSREVLKGMIIRLFFDQALLVLEFSLGNAIKM